MMNITECCYICLYSAFILLCINAMGKNFMKYLKLKKYTSSFTGPPGIPFLGNALDFVKNHEEILPILVNGFKKYYNHGWFKITIFNKFYIFPCRPQYLEPVLNSSQNITKSNDYRFFHPWLGTGLITSTGEKWRKRRKLLTPGFHFRILEDFIDPINEQSEILINELQKENFLHCFDIFPYITRCTLDIICETAMGCHVNAQKNKQSKYVEAVNKITDIIHSRVTKPWQWPDFMFALMPAGRKHKQYLKILHDFTDKTILKRRIIWASKQNKSANTKTKRLVFLDLLLDAAENGRVLSDTDIREEVDTFMFAGYDTTASAISWTLYLLGRNPDIQKKVQKELNGIFGGEKRRATADDLKEMKYLECVIKESLRLYPSVSIVARQLSEDVNIDGHMLPAGIIFMILTYMIHREPTIFTDPEKFDPDRFLPGNRSEKHPYVYIPFSAGSRNCIGQKFALMEEKIVLAHLLRSFQFESLEKETELKLLMLSNLRSRNGIIVNMKKRL